MITAFGEGAQFAKVGAIVAVIIILTCTPLSYFWWVWIHSASSKNIGNSTYAGLVWIFHFFLLFSCAGLGWLLGAGVGRRSGCSKKSRQETGNTNLCRRLCRAGQTPRRVWQPGMKIIEHPDMAKGAVLLQLQVSQGQQIHHLS